MGSLASLTVDSLHLVQHKNCVWKVRWKGAVNSGSQQGKHALEAYSQNVSHDDHSFLMATAMSMCRERQGSVAQGP